MFSQFFKPRWQHRDPRYRIEAIHSMIDNTEHHDALLTLSSDDDSRVRVAALKKLHAITDVVAKAAPFLPPSEEANVLQSRVRDALQKNEVPVAQFRQWVRQFPSHVWWTWFCSYYPDEASILDVLNDSANELDDELIALHVKSSRRTSLMLAYIARLDDLEPLLHLAKHPDQWDKRANQLLRDRIRDKREYVKREQELQQQYEKLIDRARTLLSQTQHPRYAAEYRYVQQEIPSLPEPWQSRLRDIVSQCPLPPHRTDNAVATQNNANDAVELVATTIEQGDVIENESAVTAATILPTPLVTQPDRSAEREKRRLEQDAQAQQFNSALSQLEQRITEQDRTAIRATLQSVQTSFRALPASLQHRFQIRIQHCQHEWQNLQQWQEFAALPKAEALCVEMAALASAAESGTVTDAHEHAAAIRELQQRWRALKTPHSTPFEQLWGQFKTDSDRAYRVCVISFEKEKQVRKNNLQQRQAICDMLEQYARGDWQQPDWKAVSEILATAKEEFSRFYPVERAEEKAIKARFDLALKPIADKLYQAYRQAENNKRALLAKAEQFSSLENIYDAAQGIQALQQEWKQAGQANPKIDPHLWRQFQHLCNGVFARKREQFEARQQAGVAALAQAKNYMDEVEALLRADDHAQPQSRQQLALLIQAFEHLPLPAKERSMLQKQFRQHCDAVTRHLAGARQRLQENEWQQWLQCARLCAAIELSHNTAERESWQAQWQPPTTTAAWKQVLLQRYSQAAQQPALSDAQQQQYAAQKRELILLAEIVSGSETPESEKTERRNLQLQQLQKGERLPSFDDAYVEQMLTRWFAIGSAGTAQDDALWQRLDTCLKKRPR